MFKFLKDKLKSVVSKFSKDVDEKTEKIEEPVEEIEETSVEPVVENEEKKVEPEVKVKKETEEIFEDKVETHVKEEVKVEKTKVQVGKEPAKKEEVKEIVSDKKVEKPDTIQEISKEEIIEDKIKVPVKEVVKEKDIKQHTTLSTPSNEPLVTSKVEIQKEEKSLEEVDKKLKETESKLEEVMEKKPKGIFGKLKEAITKKSLSEKEFENLFFEIEMVLLENNVAVEVIEKIKIDLKKELVDVKVLRGKVKDIIESTLKNSLVEILNINTIDLFSRIKEKKPYVIVFVGINGTGKTTSVAKFAKMIQLEGLTPVLAAADTFRAAAIQQLEEHANNLKVKMIKHDYGSDPAAVAFDAVKYAEAKGSDVVLIDTAGRQHSNTNLMDELKKLIRVVKPDLKLFVGDSLTGNDCVEQATKFNEAVGIDANVLTKVDVDEKGGAALSVAYVTGKPIIYTGSGQEYENLEKFDYKRIIEQLGF